jgi:hypothetical protein
VVRWRIHEAIPSHHHSLVAWQMMECMSAYHELLNRKKEEKNFNPYYILS